MVADRARGTEERERDAGRAAWHEDWRALKAFSPFVENSQDRLPENEARLDAARASRRAADRHVDIRVHVELPDLQRAVHEDNVSYPRHVRKNTSRSFVRLFVCFLIPRRSSPGTPRPYHSFHAGSLTRSRRWAPAGPSRGIRNPPPSAIVSRSSNDFLIWFSWSFPSPSPPLPAPSRRASFHLFRGSKEISSRIRSSYLAGKPPSRLGGHAIGLAKRLLSWTSLLCTLRVLALALLLMAITSGTFRLR